MVLPAQEHDQRDPAVQSAQRRKLLTGFRINETRGRQARLRATSSPASRAPATTSAADHPISPPVNTSSSTTRAMLIQPAGKVTSGSTTGINIAHKSAANPSRMRQSSSGTASAGAVRHRPSTRASTSAHTPAWLSNHAQFQSPLSHGIAMTRAHSKTASRGSIRSDPRRMPPSG